MKSMIKFVMKYRIFYYFNFSVIFCKFSVKINQPSTLILEFWPALAFLIEQNRIF